MFFRWRYDPVCSIKTSVLEFLDNLFTVSLKFQHVTVFMATSPNHAPAISNLKLAGLVCIQLIFSNIYIIYQYLYINIIKKKYISCCHSISKQELPQQTCFLGTSFIQCSCLAHSKVEAILGGCKDRIAWIPCWRTKGGSHGGFTFPLVENVTCQSWMNILVAWQWIDSGWEFQDHIFCCSNCASTNLRFSYFIHTYSLLLFANKQFIRFRQLGDSTSQSMFWTWPSYTVTVLCL